MDSLYVALDTVVFLLAGGAFAMIVITHREIRAARFALIIAAALLALRWITWAMFTDQPLAVRVVVGAAIGALILGGLPPLLDWAKERAQLTKRAGMATPSLPGAPIVRVRFGSDEQISWPDAQMLPEKRDRSSPFAVLVRNIGTGKAIDAELTFSVRTSLDDLWAEIQSSQVFPGAERDGTELRIPLTFVLKRPVATTQAGFSGEMVQRALSIQEDGAVTFQYPGALKNLISVLALSRAFVQGKAQMAEARKGDQILGQLLTEKNQAEVIEHFRKTMAASDIPLPDIDMTIKYRDTDNVEHTNTDTIRSLYHVITPPFWYWEDERLEKMIFKGGMGILSFEDRDNPESGFYNEAKRRGLALSEPVKESAKSLSPPIGSLRYVSAWMNLEIKSDLSQTAGRIEVEIKNDSDSTIKFHAITAGNINGMAFDFNKVEFDGFVNPHDSTFLVSNRIVGFPLKPHDINEPNFAGIYEYDLQYGDVRETNFSRRTARGIRIAQWLPFQPSGPGTVHEIPTRVVFYQQTEE